MRKLKVKKNCIYEQRQIPGVWRKILTCEGNADYTPNKMARVLVAILIREENRSYSDIWGTTGRKVI